MLVGADAEFTQGADFDCLTASCPSRTGSAFAAYWDGSAIFGTGLLLLLADLESRRLRLNSPVGAAFRTGQVE